MMELKRERETERRSEVDIDFLKEVNQASIH